MSIIDLLTPPLELAPLERLLTPDDVGGPAAWQLLIRQGALRPLWGDVALPTTAAESSELRAQAIGIAVPDTKSHDKRLVVSGRAAAWAWLGGEAPPEIEVIYQFGRHRETIPGVRVRASPFTAGQVCQVSEVWITKPERTIRDLALWCEAELAVPLIHELIAQGAKLGTAIALLEMPVRLTNRPAARQLLTQLVQAA